MYTLTFAVFRKPEFKPSFPQDYCALQLQASKKEITLLGYHITHEL